LQADNRVVSSAYIDNEYNTKIFRTQSYSISGIGNSTNVDGYNVTFTGFTESTVSFSVNGENTGDISYVPSESDYWINSADEFMLVPESFNSFDSTVTFDAGKFNTAVSVNPNIDFVKKGHTAAFRLNNQSGSIIDLNDFTFPFGNDYEKYNSWNTRLESVDSQDNISDLRVDIPSDESLGYYSSWFRWRDQTYKYFKEITIKVVPIHDLAFTQSINLNNNVPEINNFVPVI